MSNDVSEVPEFVTERLILRAVTLADAPSYQSHFADYRVIRHLGANIPWPYPEDGVHTFIQEHTIPTQGKNRWHWGIRLNTAADVVIGSIELWRPGTPENRGFWLNDRPASSKMLAQYSSSGSPRHSWIRSTHTVSSGN